ncbi:hypothetical protein FOG27_04395 [Staphylococcus delphini]|nr:hypothetical protein [Staphylococcus delphini]
MRKKLVITVAYRQQKVLSWLRGKQLYQKKEVSSMATKSFTTDYKFNSKGAKKLVQAMEKSEYAQVNRVNFQAKRLKEKKDLENFMGKVIKS